MHKVQRNGLMGSYPREWQSTLKVLTINNDDTFMHVCVCVCTDMYMCVCVCVCIYTYKYTYTIHMHTCNVYSTLYSFCISSFNVRTQLYDTYNYMWHIHTARAVFLRASRISSVSMILLGISWRSNSLNHARSASVESSLFRSFNFRPMRKTSNQFVCTRTQTHKQTNSLSLTQHVVNTSLYIFTHIQRRRDGI